MGIINSFFFNPDHGIDFSNMQKNNVRFFIAEYVRQDSNLVKESIVGLCSLGKTRHPNYGDWCFIEFYPELYHLYVRKHLFETIIFISLEFFLFCRFLSEQITPTCHLSNGFQNSIQLSEHYLKKVQSTSILLSNVQKERRKKSN